MDHNQSHDGSQGGFPGGHFPPYFPPYMYGYQGPPSWLPPGMPHLPPNVSMMQSSTNGPQVFEPAATGNASAEPDLEDVDEQAVCQSRIGKGKGKGKQTQPVTRIKLPNFSPNEDVNLVKSWLEICCDPLKSNAQKKDRMWLDILEGYNSRRESYPERTLRSIQSRWDIIKAEMGKFASMYADVIRENPSGMTDADKTTHAAANFAAILKHNFGFLHCWELMRDEPKWQDAKCRASASSAGGHGFGEDTINLGDDNSNPAGSTEKRPMGRDRAKAAKNKSSSDVGSASSLEYASRMQDLSLQKISMMQEEYGRKTNRFNQLACVDENRYQEMRSHNQSLLAIEQEKVRIMREKHDRDNEEKEKQEDERILGIDLAAFTTGQRVYYEALQEEILEKIAARRRKRQEP